MLHYTSIQYLCQELSRKRNYPPTGEDEIRQLKMLEYYWGDSMKIKIILLAVILGLGLPAMMIIASEQFFIRAAERPDVTEEVRLFETPCQTEATQSEIRIAVMFGDGSVRNMDLEEYVISVVLCEMPASFNLEALKAQAVVARTYALRQQISQQKHLSAAVCTDADCCQGYCSADEYIHSGYGSENLIKVKKTDS